MTTLITEEKKKSTKSLGYSALLKTSAVLDTGSSPSQDGAGPGTDRPNVSFLQKLVPSGHQCLRHEQHPRLSFFSSSPKSQNSCALLHFPSPWFLSKRLGFWKTHKISQYFSIWIYVSSGSSIVGLMATSSKRTYAIPTPRAPSLQQTTADLYLHRRRSNTVLSQSHLNRVPKNSKESLPQWSVQRNRGSFSH